MKKKARKTKSSKSVRSLPVKTLAAKASSVKGGTPRSKSRVSDEGPKETVTFEYGGLNIAYSQQKPD